MKYVLALIAAAGLMVASAAGAIVFSVPVPGPYADDPLFEKCIDAVRFALQRRYSFEEIERNRIDLPEDGKIVTEILFTAQILENDTPLQGGLQCDFYTFKGVDPTLQTAVVLGDAYATVRPAEAFKIDHQYAVAWIIDN